MTEPRPIHQLHRELRSTPDESEPARTPPPYSGMGGFSTSRIASTSSDYAATQEELMLEDVEDEFHRKLGRRDSGGGHRTSSLHHHHHRAAAAATATLTTPTTGSGKKAPIGSPPGSSDKKTVQSGSSAGKKKGTPPAGTPSGGGGIGSFWRSTGRNKEKAAQQQTAETTPIFSSIRMRSHNTSGGSSTSAGTEARTAATAPATAATFGQATSPGLLREALAEYDDSKSQKQKRKKEDFTTPSRNKDAIFRKDSSLSSVASTSSAQKQKKEKRVSDKQRAAERRRKMDSLTSDVDIGHIVDDTNDDHDGHFDLGSSGSMDSVGSGTGIPGPFTMNTANLPPPSDFGHLLPTTSLDRVASDASTGSLLYNKTLTSGALAGKQSSLIFPTGVDGGSSSALGSEGGSEAEAVKRRKINLLLDQCETIRFPFKKKLMLCNLGLTMADIPLKDLVGTPLGQSLHKLSLAGNRLGSVPPKLVQNLPNLKTLDLSQCELHQLPDQWNLPQLKRLNLSHNRLTVFPEEGMLKGIPELMDLNMYGNKVSSIIVPSDQSLLSKLETLNLGYNELAYLPDDLDQLKGLRVLRVMNNLLEKIPMRVCDMDLRSIDVSSNPVIQPPIETCERGICGMKRYYQCLRMEEQSKQKALEKVQEKVQRPSRKPVAKKKSGGGIMGKIMGSKPSPPASATVKTVGDNGFPITTLRSAGAPTSTKEAVKRPKNIPVPDTASRKSSALSDDSDDAVRSSVSSMEAAKYALKEAEKVTVNDTLKVIFVGMAMAGKTSMINRLIEGREAVVPAHDERTVGVDIYEWEPTKDRRFEHIDSRINFMDKELAATCGDVNVKFSVWDFAGQHVYHATHELFFSSRALYCLVWDMGATNRATFRSKRTMNEERGAFTLYDSSDDESEAESEDDVVETEEEARRADRALERDIDEKVQFWVDCIQSSAPGAAILPVASFADYFAEDGGEAEAKRRCNMLKQRLEKHEARRIEGIKQRLKEYLDQNRANDQVAIRLRKLLCPYTRPKLIFGDDDSVVRVSGTQYTGFDRLTAKIVGIATGRDKGQGRYPIFHGHIGARIPRMRSEVRETVREMRGRFKVVEWGYFINQLRDRGLTNVEDISDALHFLTNIGELSYFGSVMNSRPGANLLSSKGASSSAILEPSGTEAGANGNFGSNTRQISEDYDEMDDEKALLSMEDTSITAPSTADGSLTTVEDLMSSGLSQFVFLNPRWLVAAVACILRHDLDREIKETRRIATGQNRLSRATSFYDAHLNCPVITSEDALLLWQAKRLTKKAAERAQETSNNMSITPFEFLQLLLIRFGVFVPIDLTIEKAFLGGQEYSQLVSSMLPDSSSDMDASTPAEIRLDEPDESSLKAKFFFLPSLLGPGEPNEVWTYKTSESWKTTLCHSILFPDGVPPGLMERLTASVLSSIYAVSARKEDSFCKDPFGREVATYEGQLSVKEILCWRTAFFVKIGMQVSSPDGTKKESIVEIFTHIADREHDLCVGSDFMGVGMRRLIISGRGQVGDCGRKIWKGGYLLVCKSISRVMDAYGGLEFEKQGFCPKCIAEKPVKEAGFWDFTTFNLAVMNSESSLRCQHGHKVDTPLVMGPVAPGMHQSARRDEPHPTPSTPVQDLLRAVVVVGLWDGRSRKIVRVGSGFVVDRKRGLIVTAAHTLMNIWGDQNYPFGENYYGLRQGKIVIGVLPRIEESDRTDGRDMAVFRYFAKVVAKDPSLDRGECHLDACVLRITTRMENDVGGDGKGCDDQPERLLLNNPEALRREKLQTLKITDRTELDEQVRILGYNQGGGGLLGPGESLNRCVDFAKGYVCQFAGVDESGTTFRDRFKPREEIVVICPTIGGHSGGPCVNQQGEVIGILSRADPAENQRCYISPTSEWKSLVKQAKNVL